MCFYNSGARKRKNAAPSAFKTRGVSGRGSGSDGGGSGRGRKLIMEYPMYREDIKMGEDDYTKKGENESRTSGTEEGASAGTEALAGAGEEGQSGQRENVGDPGQVVYREVVVERIKEKDGNNNNNTLGTISLITGIVGLVMFFCCIFIDVILAIVAIVTGILGYKDNQQYALVGIILGSITLGLSVLAIAGLVSLAILEGLF